jgi:hypothetical protein
MSGRGKRFRSSAFKQSNAAVASLVSQISESQGSSAETGIGGGVSAMDVQQAGAYPGSASSVPYNVAGFVNALLNSKAEKKYFVVASGTTALTTGQLIMDISSVAQGTTDVTRIGDEIHIKSLEMRFAAYLTGSGDGVLRVYMFQWFPDDNVSTTDPMGTAGNPRVRAGIQILQTTATSTAWCTLWNAPPNKENSQSYSIIWDRAFALTSGTSTAQHVKHVWAKQFRKRLIRYSSGTDGMGKIFLGFVTGMGLAVGALNATVNVYTKLNYTDL